MTRKTEVGVRYLQAQEECLQTFTQEAREILPYKLPRKHGLATPPRSERRDFETITQYISVVSRTPVTPLQQC